MFAGKKSAQIREILISESAWEEMTCLFAPSLKQDAAPPPPHAIEDGYRGTDDAKKMTVDFAKNMHDGASVSLRGNLISHKGEDRYVFRDKSGEINVVIPAAVFDGREVQPDQMINISGSLDKKSAPAVVRVTHLQK